MNLLFTSVGRRSYLIKYFRKAISVCGGEIHVMNSTDISPVFRLADKATVSPLIYDKEYIPFLLKYCVENKIDTVISLFDIDLPLLAKNKDTFASIGTRVIVSDVNVIDICNDKWKTYQFLKKNGMNVPATFLSFDEAKGALECGQLQYPVIIKPRWGMGSISIFIADNAGELDVLYNKTRKDIFNTYLKYESVSDMENCVLIQEKMSGQEYGLDVINDLKGCYQNTVVKKKYAMRSGETDCAMTVENNKLKKLGLQISDKLHHIGNLDVDVFLDNDKAYVLEMNARFGGGYPFSHMAGVDLPLAIIRWLNGESIDADVLKEKIGVLSQKDISLVKIKENSF